MPLPIGVLSGSAMIVTSDEGDERAYFGVMLIKAKRDKAKNALSLFIISTIPI